MKKTIKLNIIDKKLDYDYILSSFNKAIEYRECYYADDDTTAFRVFNDQGDGISGITVDYFDGFYLITWYSSTLYEQRSAILKALKAVVDYRGIYQKRRFDARGGYLDDTDDFICGERADEPLIIQESGLNFAIYLDDGAMVGVFLDQREVRRRIRDHYAMGKTVLNTFSYTGAFSVFAAIGGALRTTSVDLANRSRTKTQEQFRINGIEPKEHDIVVDDVFGYFKYAVRKGILFDMVILDPPSFARSKKHTFSVSKDYKNLLKEAIAITNHGGVIVASTNYANLTMKSFKSFVTQAFGELNEQYHIEESFSLPSDFRVGSFGEGDYLKVLFVRKI